MDTTSQTSKKRPREETFDEFTKFEETFRKPKRPKPEETKKKISIGLKKYYKTVNPKRHREIMAAVSGKKIIQYNSMREFVREYVSISEAARATGLTKANIQHAVSGRNDTAGGYIWEFS